MSPEEQKEHEVEFNNSAEVFKPGVSEKAEYHPDHKPERSI